MALTVAVNTCALGPRAREILSSGGVVHAQRLALLREELLPRLIGDPLVDEVIVVGEYEPGDGYRYLHCPSVAFDCTDALAQRDLAARNSTSDTILFLHDDHLPDPSFFQQLAGYTLFDVLVPQRWCWSGADRVVPMVLNNGQPDYVMGHAVVMSRTAVEAVPWRYVEKVFTWDVDHTQRLVAAGLCIENALDLGVEDMEARLGARPWE